MIHSLFGRRIRIGGSRARALLALFMIGGLALAHSVHAQSGTSTEPVLTSEQQKTADAIFNELVSPCCWTTTVAVHGSGAAPRIQAEVRQMLAQGMGYQEILDRYVEEYGERILAKPKKKGFNLAAYWLPYLGLLAGATLVFMSIRRGMKRGRALAKSPAVVGRDLTGAKAGGESPPAPGSDDDYRRRIEEELRHSS